MRTPSIGGLPVVLATLLACSPPSTRGPDLPDVPADVPGDPGPEPADPSPADGDFGDAAAEAAPADLDADADGTDPAEGDPGRPDLPDDPGPDDPGSADSGPHPSSCVFLPSAALANAWVPPGFCAWNWAEGLANPRGLEVVGNDVLVVERSLGQVTLLFDGNGDGVVGSGERVVLARAPGLNHGIAVGGGWLYASSTTTVYRWAYTPGDRKDLGDGAVVVRDLPAGGHATRTLVLDAQGRLYVSVGSGSNVDPDASRAGILRFDPGTVPAGGIQATAGEWFASGLRNEVGLAFDDQGRLWGVENGVDNLARPDLGGDLHLSNPAEEVNRFDVPGAFYGYPYCWSEYGLPAGVGLGPGTQWAHPDFLGDGTHTDGWCRDPARVTPPRFAMEAHNAPLGIVFARGEALPGIPRGDAFVAMHGSWNDDPATGYKVIRLAFDGGPDPVRAEPFLEYAGAGDTGNGWPHRPVDVRLGPGGVLLVTSDASGRIVAVGEGAVAR